MLNVALTHDVDRVKKTYQYFTGIIKSLQYRNWNQASYHFKSFFNEEPYWNFEKIMNIEQKYGVKSTFFFMHESIPFELFYINNWALSLGRYKLNQTKISNIIKTLDQEGWEIGLHGSYNSFMDIKLLEHEKKILESILEHEVQGVRQHYLNLNSETWEYQRKVGFNYDSTHGFTNSVGYKGGEYLPFRPFSDHFVVFPLVIMDQCIINMSNSWAEFLQLCELSEEKGGVLVINWHQRDFNTKEFPGHSEFYEKMIVELKNRGAMFKTLNEYYKDIAK